MIDVCAAMLLVLTLCGPASGTGQVTPNAVTQIMRVSLSGDLLGRQMVVAPAAIPFSDPRRMALCGPDGIQRTLDGGQTWSRVPTDGVAALAADTPMPLSPRSGATPPCQSVT